MAEDRKHEIIEINKKEDLTNSYFVRRGIILSRNCDNNRLNVWIEGTLFENLEIFYHCENETESTPDKAFDLFEVGRKVLVLHKFIYSEEDISKIERIERTVIGLKYNSPEGINNLQPCVVKRFFAKIKKGTGSSTVYSYYWICIDNENNVTALKINNNEDKTETEVSNGTGFYSELESALYLGEVGDGALTQSATKSFMMTNDKGFRERWVATPCSLFKDQQKIINIVPSRWATPPPCDPVALPCPPNRFYCDTENRILVWYGAYEIFIGAAIVRFDTDTQYTFNCVAASGASISGDEGYETLVDTEWDIPLNMISGVNSVSDTEISFYLPYGTNRRPGQVTIDWVNYVWGTSISANVTNYAAHWYWTGTGTGFEKKELASLSQGYLDGTVEDKYEDYSLPDPRNCNDFNYEDCLNNNNIVHYTGIYKRVVDHCNGYHSNYTIKVFDESFNANTLVRNLSFEEQKYYTAGKCQWNSLGGNCEDCGAGVYSCAIRNIPEQLYQKSAGGLSAFWSSNNVAYFYEEKNRNKCWAYASQGGWLKNVCGTTNIYIYWGGSNQSDFDDCEGSDGCLTFDECPAGLGKCFELTMPGGDWFSIGSDHVDFMGSGSHGDRYDWIKETDVDIYGHPIIRKFKIDEVIEFDATKIYKTYYLDDRATCHEQGLVVAGKGVRDSKIFWEVYHDGIDITEKLFEALNCKQSELDEMGLI